MGTWFFGHYDAKEASEILSKFSRYRMEAGFQHDMALFYRHNPKHDTTTLFFSPLSHEVAKMFNAAPCGKPDREKLLLYCGDERKTWQILFPESKR